MTEVERLKGWMEDNDVMDIKVSIASPQDAETVCGELNKSIAAIEAGDFEEVKFEEDIAFPIAPDPDVTAAIMAQINNVLSAYTEGRTTEYSDY